MSIDPDAILVDSLLAPWEWGKVVPLFSGVSDRAFLGIAAVEESKISMSIAVPLQHGPCGLKISTYSIFFK